MGMERFRTTFRYLPLFRIMGRAIHWTWSIREESSGFDG
jgi:hypothetical protein